MVREDPFKVLELPPDADEAAIRQRYLELVRQFTPERHPDKFSAIRAAYDSLQDPDERLRRALFDAVREDSIDSIIEELTNRGPRRRLSLKKLLST